MSACQPVVRPVILCGGGGSRLWPVSRFDRPKPFVPMHDGRCSFDLALDLARLPGMGKPIIITSVQTQHLVQHHLAKAGVVAEVFLETMACNTAFAIAIAAEAAFRHDATTLLLVLPADHWIEDLDGFERSLAQALGIANLGYLCVFGIVPDRPETQYGYIQRGEDLGHGAARVACFSEKPDAAKAVHLVQDGWLWNAGNFIGQAQLFRQELQAHAPEVFKAAVVAFSGSETVAATGGAMHLLAAPHAVNSFVPLPFDVAVMERTTLAAVVILSSRWADCGTWEAVWAQLQTGENAGLTVGPVQAHDTRASLLWSDGPQVVALGLTNMVVAATADGVLVAERSTLSTLKPVVEKLKPAEAAAARLPGLERGSLLLHQSATAAVSLVTIEAGSAQQWPEYSAPGHLLVLEGCLSIGQRPDTTQIQAGDSVAIATGQSLDLRADTGHAAIVIATSFKNQPARA